MIDPKSFKDGRGIAASASCREASFAQLGEGEPQKLENDGSPTWICRGANFLVAATLIQSGSKIVQHGIPDESMMLLAPTLDATIFAGGVASDVSGEALAILPPGDATLHARGTGMLIRIFSAAASEFADLASNREAYRSYPADVAPLVCWPEPVGGFKLRLYPLADHCEDVGFGRLFRSTNLMVNIFQPSSGPRDASALSPHEHSDFEQGSLTLAGEFVHHLRTPWGPDSTLWRPDRSIACSGLSLIVIPPRMIHTTGWSSSGARLVDVFAPPRMDFSLKPRWVRNAEDYPLPTLANDPVDA